MKRTFVPPAFKSVVSLPILAFGILTIFSSTSFAQKKLWSDRLLATNAFLQQHMWNPTSGNFVRRADMPQAAGSDAWGITIILDAYAYMVEEGFMKPDELKRYYVSSSSLYEKTDGDRGARILARQGSEIYIGGDDDLQWTAALAHCYLVTKDPEYLTAARYAFNALIEQGFWKDSIAKGWAWNSNDQRPNGVSTAYGALAAARLFAATGDQVFKKWAAVSLNALATPQVGFFPRDEMVAANAALTVYEVTKQTEYLDRAKALAARAATEADQVIAGTRTGERNPTDVGDLAEGYFALFDATHNTQDKTRALKLIEFFFHNRNSEDITLHGFYSRYDVKGNPVLEGNYLGVPLSVAYLPEVAEMLKLCAVAYRQ